METIAILGPNRKLIRSDDPRRSKVGGGYTSVYQSEKNE